MSNTASADRPPKPQFALSIGVVGHKPDRLTNDSGTLDAAEAAIRNKVDEIFAAIARTDALTKLEATLHIDARAATELLWRTYHPAQFWVPFAAIGFVSAMNVCDGSGNGGW